MPTNTNGKNLLQRMLAVQSELNTVAKNLVVKTSTTNSYKAVSERDVLDAVKPLEQKHGIYSCPWAREIVDQGDYEKENQAGYKTLSRYLRIKTVYRFFNVDNMDEYIDMTSYGDGIDSGDKATGKAMTYADKYALMKAYKISTGDDPDQKASDEYTAKKEPNIRKQDVEMIRALIIEGIFDESKLLAFYKADKLENLTEAQGKELVRNGMKRRNAKQTDESA